MTSLQYAVPPLETGLFGIGLDTYWYQFTGLKNRFPGYIDTVAQQLQGYSAGEGCISSANNTAIAFKAAHQFPKTAINFMLNI